MSTVNLSITAIQVPPGGRDLREEQVAEMAQSMQKLGQLTAIGVRMTGETPELVYGRHRYAAAQSLGWSEIECNVLEVDDRQARMAEIAENLHRAELTALERSNQIAEWVTLAEEGISARVAQKSGPGRPEGGVAAAARELGIGRDAARRAETVASLPQEAKAAAVRLSFDDNQSALLAAAKAADPVAALEERAKSRVSPSSAAMADAKAERQARRARKERQLEEKRRRAEAIEKVADLLIECIGDRMPEFVELLDVINGYLFLECGLAKAIHERRADLYDWIDEESETGAGDDQAGAVQECTAIETAADAAVAAV